MASCIDTGEVKLEGSSQANRNGVITLKRESYQLRPLFAFESTGGYCKIQEIRINLSTKTHGLHVSLPETMDLKTDRIFKRIK